MTKKEIDTICTRITDMVMKEVSEMLLAYNDEPMGLKDTARMLGCSEAWVYKNQEKLGGMKFIGKLFFSKNRIAAIIRNKNNNEDYDIRRNAEGSWRGVNGAEVPAGL